MVFFLPVLLPGAADLGVDPIHFGVIVVVSLTIGLFVAGRSAVVRP